MASSVIFIQSEFTNKTSGVAMNISHIKAKITQEWLEAFAAMAWVF